jgi:NAD(P)-dependent dehydrogenase (short-subunit alcohol dehydrogenase family)
MTTPKPGPALFDLSRRVAVITGGGGALGSEICAGFARAGAVVMVVDINIDNARRVAEAIIAEGGRAMALSGDVSKEPDVHQIFDEIHRAHKKVDILVNGISAAIERCPPEEVTLEQWKYMLDTNLTSYFLCSQYAARGMIQAGGGGSIINISSIGGATALGRGAMAYGVAKGAILQLTRETSFAWAQHKIRVNAILPCQFTNAWWAARQVDPSSQTLVRRVLTAIPLGRLGEPHEIVGPALFLASDAASMVTGVLLPVDGGNLAMNSGGSIEW